MHRYLVAFSYNYASGSAMYLIIDRQQKLVYNNKSSTSSIYSFLSKDVILVLTRYGYEATRKLSLFSRRESFSNEKIGLGFVFLKLQIFRSANA